MGHVYRMLSLGLMLHDRYEITLASKNDLSRISEHPSIKHQLIPENVGLKDEPAWLQKNFPANEFLLIVDGYQFEDSYFDQLHQSSYRIFYLDDFYRSVSADVIVNLALNADLSKYIGGEKTKVLVGSKYALLRPEFFSPKEHKRTDSCIVAFGSSDIQKLSVKAVDACLQTNAFSKVHVLTGFEPSQALNLLAENDTRVKLHQNLNAEQLVNILDSCSIAFGSASGIAYEFCSRQLPFFCGYYASNQEGFYNGLTKHQLCIGLGEISNFNTEDFKRALDKHLGKNQDEIIQAQKLHFDGKSRTRWQNQIAILAAKLTIRECNMTDAHAVFEMANDPVVRQNSYHSEEISLDVHMNWFEEKIRDSKSHLYALEIGDNMAGFVRFDRGEKEAVIGLIVMKEFRGFRLASPMLVLACEEFHKKHRIPVLAYIKKSNARSSKSFYRANFEFLREETIHGVKSEVLELQSWKN